MRLTFCDLFFDPKTFYSLQLTGMKLSSFLFEKSSIFCIFSTSQVELTDIWIIEEVLSSPLITVVPHLQNIAVIGIFENHRRFLLHDQAWKTRFFDFDNLFEDCFDPFGRKSEGRLVEEKELGLDHQSPRQREHLLFSTAHLGGFPLLHFRQPGKELVDPFEAFLFFCLVLNRPGTHIQMLLNGHIRKDDPSLRVEGHPFLHDLMGWRVGDLFS